MSIEEMNWLLDTIETAYQEHKQAEIANSHVLPTVGQLPLPIIND